ncbi:hypothetical protein RUND412_009257, partial [Rhizina undulata]
MSGNVTEARPPQPKLYLPATVQQPKLYLPPLTSQQSEVVDTAGKNIPEINFAPPTIQRPAAAKTTQKPGQPQLYLPPPTT